MANEDLNNSSLNLILVKLDKVQLDVATLSSKVAVVETCLKSVKKDADERKKTQDDIYKEIKVILHGESGRHGLVKDVNDLRSTVRGLVWGVRALFTAVVAELAHLLHQFFGK